MKNEEVWKSKEIVSSVVTSELWQEYTWEVINEKDKLEKENEEKGNERKKKEQSN